MTFNGNVADTVCIIDRIVSYQLERQMSDDDDDDEEAAEVMYCVRVYPRKVSTIELSHYGPIRKM